MTGQTEFTTQSPIAAGSSVAVLAGGSSLERAVSLRTGERVATAVRRAGWKPVLIDPAHCSDLETQLRERGAAAVVVALHGEGGEDGVVQAVLEESGLPYTGPRPGPARATYDKARTKRLLRAAGIATPEFVALTVSSLEQYGAADVLGEVAATIPAPLVVKPACGGSALGVRLVTDPEQLPGAIVGAASHDDTILVEQFVSGTEMALCTVGVAGDVRVLPPVQFRARHAQLFDSDAHYAPGEARYDCPPPGADEQQIAQLADLARQVHDVLDLDGCAARSDVIVDRTGAAWVLEVDTLPGLTDTSLYPLAWGASGHSFDELVIRLVGDAVALSAG